MNMNPENQNHPELDGPLESAVWAVLSVPVPADAIERVQHNARVAAATRAAPPPTVTRSNFLTRRMLMKTLLASSGVAIVAVAALFLSTEFSSNSQAYAEVLKQIKAARTLTYTNYVYVETQAEPIKTKEYCAADGRRRSEHGSLTTIFDDHSMIRLTLIGDTKTAMVIPPSKDQASLPSYTQRDWIESLSKLSDKPDKELGEKQLDGRTVIGFEASHGPTKFTLWLDAQSKQVVRIELDHPRIQGMPVLKSAMTDFRFDEPLDEALFSLEVPAGYKVMELNPVVMEQLLDGELNIVEALRGYTKKADGKFPTSLTDWGDWAELFSKDSTDGKLSPETTKVMGHLGAILPFLTGLSQDDYAYLGDGKTTEEATAIIFWYKNKAGVYRAIFGDLSVKDVTKEQLPAPAQVGKKGQIPAGDRVVKIAQLPAGVSIVTALPEAEGNVVEALRGYSHKAKGKYPKSLTEWGEWTVLFSEDSAKGKPSPETTRTMKSLGATLPFLTGLSKDDYAYLGEGKTTEEATAIIFWYKNEAGVYRAIFGDLSVKDVNKEQLPVADIK